MTTLAQIDAKIESLLALRIILALAPAEHCNRINDELAALRAERVKITEEERL